MDSLTDKEREAYFPVHIDLGKEGHGMPTEMGDSGSSKGNKQKPKTYYPTLYIDGISGLEQLPKEGCMLVEFRRKRLSVEENSDGDETAGVGLEIRALCLPKEMPEEAAEDLDSVLSKYGQSDESDSEEDDEEE